MTPLRDTVEEVSRYAKAYSGRGKFHKMLRMRRDNGKLDDLKERVGTLVGIMGLAGIARSLEQQAGLRGGVDMIKTIQQSQGATLVSERMEDQFSLPKFFTSGIPMYGPLEFAMRIIALPLQHIYKTEKTDIFGFGPTVCEGSRKIADT